MSDDLKLQPQSPRVLSYRTPGTGPPRMQRVLGELTTAETLSAAGLASRVAFGVPLTLIAPFLITLILLGVERRARGDVLPGFFGTFFLVSLMIVPLLMWYERRTRGEFFADSVRGEESIFGASSYGEYQMLSAKYTWTAYVEIALTGPRMLWEAVDMLRGRPSVNLALRTLAAEIALELFDAGEGRLIRELVRPDRPIQNVKQAADYLIKLDWAGISRKRDRVWLASNIREKLAGV